MITSLKTSEGYIFAVSEWWICNVNGHLQDDGEYCQVREMWIHPAHRSVSTLREIVHKMNNDKFMLNVKWVYWRRDKYEKISKLFPRERFIKEMSYGRQ